MSLSVSQVFALFAKGESTCPKEDVATIVRSQGLCPTEAELTGAMGSIGDTADLGAVEGVVGALSGTKYSDLDERLKKAFAVFDPDQTGAVPLTELSHMCTNMGDKLPEEDFNKIMLEAPDDGFGGIEYSKFATLLQSKLGGGGNDDEGEGF